MIKSEAFVSAQTEIEPPNHPETSQKFVANPLAILYILLLFFGLIAWSIWTSLALLKNEEPQYPKALFSIPFLILLTLPSIISLFIILLRTVYTLYSKDFEVMEALDLVGNEEQRKLVLMPLSVSGFIMTILPAYYFKYQQHYDILGSEGVLGLMLILLFLGMALVPEKESVGSNANALTIQHRLFITIHKK